MDNQAASSEERNGDIVRRRRRTHGLQVRATDSPVSPPRRSVTLSRSTPPVDNRAPLHVTRRIHAYPTSHLQRHRLRRQREDDALGTVQDAVNRLNEVTSNLTSVLDEPLPQILGPDEFTGLIDDMDGYNRRSKRRKLDADPLDPQTSFSYGYHGQVTPGRLKMTINSCDGGHLTDTEELLPERNYNPENVLRNDKSVYCSKKDRCNMVLKHWGETPFTVTKMIIKAPDCGFTAPVQEGMVFIAMSNEQLTARASHYQIQSTCPHALSLQRSERIREQQSDTHRLSHGVSGRFSPPRRARRLSSMFSAPRASFTYINPPFSRAESPDTDSTPPPDDVYPFGYIPQPIEAVARDPDSSSPQGYRVTTSCDDPSGDEEEPSSQEILIDRQQRRHRMDDSSTSEEDDEPRRLRRQRKLPRRIELVDKEIKTEVKKPPQEPIPCVKFFIERKKHVVSMKFDPPISGRYILVKLWSPEGHNNIDIQNVSVHGFAGPRYFPGFSMA